jgi:hypothetical protein
MTDREEFQKLIKRLDVLAEKMGQRVTIIVRRKPAAAPPKSREPGEE